MICAAPRSSVPSTDPRRLDRSPATSPKYSRGVEISTFMIGSSWTGMALRSASRKPSDPAISKAISLESTGCVLPSVSATLTSTTG